MKIKKFQLFSVLIACAAALNAFETPKQAVDAAIQAARKKNYAEAHKCLEEGYKLSVNPTEKSIVLSWRGEVYNMQRDFQNAEKTVMEIVNDPKMTPQMIAGAWVRIARWREAQKKYEDAVDAYQKILELCKEGNQAQEALNRCGTLLVLLKDYSGAIECYKRVSTIQNKDARRAKVLKMASHNNIASAYTAMKQYANAVKTLEEAAKLPEFKDPRDQTSFKKAIASIYMAQIREAVRFKRFDEADAALNEFRKCGNARQIKILEIALLNGKAAFADRKRETAAAESYYQEALKVAGPDSPDAIGIYAELINHYLRLKKNAEAEKALQQLLAIPCKDAETQFNVNFVKMRYLCAVNKHDEAVKLMEETAGLKGLRPFRVVRCYELICSIYLNINDVKSAKLYLEKAAAVPGANWKCPPYLKKRLGL